jgi:ribosomal-protein-alanine N-acetyltransferase
LQGEKTFKGRLFETRDMDQVMEINLKCLPENYSSYFYLDLYNHFPKTFIVAEDDEKIVGYIMCRVEYGFSEMRSILPTKKGHIVSVAVLPEHRRRGVGRSLVIHAMRALTEYGATECFLEVRVGNDTAISLYKNLGFATIRKVEGYYQDGEAAYVMSRRLPYNS